MKYNYFSNRFNYYDKGRSLSYLANDRIFKTTDFYKKYINELRQITKNISDLIILDFGCGTLRYIDAFENNFLQYVGIDKSQYMISTAKNNSLNKINLQVGDINILNSSAFQLYFSFVFSIGTLGEYVQFNVKTLNQFYSVLKEGGYFFFTLVDSEKNHFTPWMFFKNCFMTKTIFNPLKFMKHIKNCTYSYTLKRFWLTKSLCDRFISTSKFDIIKYMNFYDGKYYKHVYILQK